MNFGLMIESLVAILLAITIGYCALLNRRLAERLWKLRKESHARGSAPRGGYSDRKA